MLQNDLQAYIRTAALMLQNIQEGVFDVSNEAIIISHYCWEALCLMFR
uniref:Uncharacterized protein n=1 Tax=Rhizophora mucronata TaxID=61149 RepID=A0A2P2NG72_RHIMU